MNRNTNRQFTFDSTKRRSIFQRRKKRSFFEPRLRKSFSTRKTNYRAMPFLLITSSHYSLPDAIKSKSVGNRARATILTLPGILRAVAAQCGTHCLLMERIHGFEYQLPIKSNCLSFMQMLRRLFNGTVSRFAFLPCYQKALWDGSG